MRYEFRVIINGTDENPWHKMGLQCNPFPQIAKYEFITGELQINSLDGDPIHEPDEIRRRLKGCSEEFIELCIQNFKPGQRTEFDVFFDYDG